MAIDNDPRLSFLLKMCDYNYNFPVNVSKGAQFNFPGFDSIIISNFSHHKMMMTTTMMTSP